MFQWLRRKQKAKRPNPSEKEPLTMEQIEELRLKRIEARRKAGLLPSEEEQTQYMERKYGSLRLHPAKPVPPEEIEELKKTIMPQMGYLPPDEIHDDWWKPEQEEA